MNDAGGWPAATVQVRAASPRAGVTAVALERLLVLGGPRAGLALSPSRVPRLDVRGQGPCPEGTRRTGGTLLAAIGPADRLDLEWRAPSGCTLAEITVAFARQDPAGAVDRALRLVAARLARPVPLTPVDEAAPTGSRVEGGPLRPMDPDLSEVSRLESLEALRGVDPRLAGALRRRMDLRHREGADGSDGFIDGPHLVRNVLLEVFGKDLGSSLRQLIAAGPRVPADPATLRPGDLLFLTSFAGFPRRVMLYLGAGKKAEATEVRGVVVEEIPRSVPNYLYLIAIRPPLGA